MGSSYYEQVIFIVYGVPGVVWYDGVHPMLAGWWNQGMPDIVIPELFIPEVEANQRGQCCE